MEKGGKKFRSFPMKEGKGDNNEKNDYNSDSRVMLYIAKEFLKEGKMFLFHFSKEFVFQSD